MKIVGLDALPFNPGDLDWSPLAWASRESRQRLMDTSI